MGTKTEAIKKRLDSLEWEMKQLRILIDSLDDEDVIKEASVMVNNVAPATPVIPEDYDNVYKISNKVKEQMLDYIYLVEGGYYNHPNDPGGPTNYGITWTDAREELGYTGDMKDFTRDQATAIYLNKYYLRNKLFNINDPRVMICIFDLCVHSGSGGKLVAQKTVNDLAGEKVINEDSALGPISFEAINKCEPQAFIEKYCELQKEFYARLIARKPHLSDFREGWNNRVDRKLKFLNGLK